MSDEPFVVGKGYGAGLRFLLAHFYKIFLVDSRLSWMEHY